LFPGRATELAAKLYHSLHDKLITLPDHCEVYPSHGAGSLCGRSMGAKWRSTIGYERLHNGALQIRDQAAFVESLTANMPAAPDHFSRCSDINRGGPVQVSDLPELRELEPAAFYDQMEALSAAVLDVRSYMAYASMHIPGSWHLDPNGNLPTFAGWVLPIDRDILLVVDDYADAVTANRWVRRVGVDRIVGCLRGGMTAWVNAGLQTADIQLISAEGLHDRVTGTSNFVLVDVRAPLEFQNSHIQGAVNIPTADLRTRHQELDPQKPTIVICSAGNRSSLAASILEQHGFREITSVAGGMRGYSVAGYAKHCAVCENPHGSRYESKYILTEPS
jgi:rhodanese-related sulfurtransferase